jgi:NADPH:quinone reductase-like Zn-dependent oxidoreductase
MSVIEEASSKSKYSLAWLRPFFAFTSEWRPEKHFIIIMEAKNQAAYLTGPKVKPFQVKDAPMPVPTDNEIVIRNRAVGINPADWAVQNMGILVKEYPFILGCDIAGDVYQVGSKVTKFKVGDRVTAMASAFSNKGDGSSDNLKGAFQLVLRAGVNNVAKIPDSVSYSEASVLPLCITTAASALFDKDHLGLPLPQLEPKSQGKVILIWGGSSSVGALAIQMAVAAGFDVATTASAHNLEFLRSLGAKYVFDRKSSTVVEDITTSLNDTEFGGCLVAAAFNSETFGNMSLESPEILQCGEIAKKLGGNMFVQTVKAPPPAMALTKGLPEGVKTGNGQLPFSYVWYHGKLLLSRH